jgi:hypothetical protein
MSILERLTQHLQSLPRKLREFIEEEHPAMGQRNLARHGMGAAAQ